jgi:acrylyl-CoA reductase (NADPH)/3-hydroxypropionyl-CoA dehydratase/3-hydroxypropionyl-CoA synthetase
MAAALEMLLGGRTVAADEAHALGLVDEVTGGSDDVLSRAVARVRELVTAHPDAPPPPLARAYGARRARLQGWAAPGDPALMPDDHAPRLAALRAQAEGAGRAGAAARVLEAVRTGWARGLDAGLRHEARLFAEAVVDPHGGKRGIRDFFEKRSAPLPARAAARPDPTDAAGVAALVAAGELLPVGAPFWPGVTPLPRWQYAHGVARDPRTGAPGHGEPAGAERELITRVDPPGPHDALVYVLASEVNFNDIWAITGFPSRRSTRTTGTCRPPAPVASGSWRRSAPTRGARDGSRSAIS